MLNMLAHPIAQNMPMLVAVLQEQRLGRHLTVAYARRNISQRTIEELGRPVDGAQ